MAKHQAIAAVCNTIVRHLESQSTPQDFAGDRLQFKVFQAQDFARPMKAGISLFLYRITQNSVSSNRPPGRLNPDGIRQKPPLPLDLHFLLTAWAKNANLQQKIAGWMLRKLEDTPILNASLLNQRYPGVFQSDESVEVLLEPLSAQELFGFWEGITRSTYQISVAYLARRVCIE